LRISECGLRIGRRGLPPATTQRLHAQSAIRNPQSAIKGVAVANTQSAKKRMRQQRRQGAKNRVQRSALRTAIRKVRSAATAAEARRALLAAERLLDRAARKRLVHPNTAARQKTRLHKLTKRVGG
jgi:small subunit ribosomal protein S20